MNVISYEKYSQLRNKANLNDNNISEKTGIRRALFSEWKSGKSAPTTNNLMKIADALNISFVDFIDYVTCDKHEELMKEFIADNIKKTAVPNNFSYYYDGKTPNIRIEIESQPDRLASYLARIMKNDKLKKFIEDYFSLDEQEQGMINTLVSELVNKKSD